MILRLTKTLAFFREILYRDDLLFAVRRLILKLIVLAALGVAILSLWLILSVSTESVGVEILSIMGWVCVWDATNIAIIERPAMFHMLKNLRNLIGSEIRFETADDPNSVESDQTIEK